MVGADPEKQYHLATDASKTATGGVLFQLIDHSTGTEAVDKLRNFERIIMFMSFRLTDAESPYHTTERETLAVVRGLSEVRWLVMGSPFSAPNFTH